MDSMQLEEIIEYFKDTMKDSTKNVFDDALAFLKAKEEQRENYTNCTP